MHEIVDDLEKGFLVASTVMYFVGVVVGLVVVEFNFNQFSLTFEDITVNLEAR